MRSTRRSRCGCDRRERASSRRRWTVATDSEALWSMAEVALSLALLVSSVLLARGLAWSCRVSSSASTAPTSTTVRESTFPRRSTPSLRARTPLLRQRLPTSLRALPGVDRRSAAPDHLPSRRLLGDLLRPAGRCSPTKGVSEFRHAVTAGYFADDGHPR